MEADFKPIMDELKIIRKELHDIRSTMPNKDMFLSEDEKKILKTSHKNEDEGELVSSKDLRKDLGI
jgi:hypothetical protein